MLTHTANLIGEFPSESAKRRARRSEEKVASDISAKLSTINKAGQESNIYYCCYFILFKNKILF
jgi:hypothetical protein